MKNLIYRNVIVVIIFVLLPYFLYEKFYKPGVSDLYTNLIFAVVFIGSLYLIYINIIAIRIIKGKSRIVSVLFLLLPVLIVGYFILAFIAFSNFTGF